MLWRWLNAGIAGLLAVAGAALLDCTFFFLDFVDAYDVCVELDVSVPGGSMVVGTVLLLCAAVLVGYAWVPFFMALYRERDNKQGFEATSEALARNVHRLPEEASGPVENLLSTQDHQEEFATEEASVDLQEPQSTEPLDAKESLLSRTTEMELLVREEQLPSEEISMRWIGLLREANELHNRQAIDTATFKETNSRLLALYVSPDDDPYTRRRKVGSEISGADATQSIG